MADWPHAPVHRVDPAGVYMVTAATYWQIPIFNSAIKLGLLQARLFKTCEKYEVKLEAWCIFPNHYHFIGTASRSASIGSLVKELHTLTAREVNRLDQVTARRVWFQCWDKLIQHQGAYFARLRYVHDNAVRHGIVCNAVNYRWCSAGWFEQRANRAFRKTVLAFPITRLRTPDDFEVNPNDIEG
jgi:putative transposase